MEDRMGKIISDCECDYCTRRFTSWCKVCAGSRTHFQGKTLYQKTRIVAMGDESFEQFSQYCTLRDKEEYEHNGLSLCYAIHGAKINGCDTDNCPRLKAKERTSCALRQESVNSVQQS